MMSDEKILENAMEKIKSGKSLEKVMKEARKEIRDEENIIATIVNKADEITRGK